MRLRVLVVPDKFKGTLTALAAAQAIAQGWREVRPQDRLELLPMSDGGDGFGEVLARLHPAEAREILTVDAAHRPCAAAWWWAAAQRVAIIESARVVGLALLPQGKYHPFNLDSFGLGTLLEAAAQAGAAPCILGIGGSATNDGGFGVARALGWRFLDGHGKDICQWTCLTDLAQISSPRPAPPLPELLVAVDVQNPLLGPSGASRVYGPQKGLRPEDMGLAESCLARLAERVRLDLGLAAAEEPGTGAAGGLGFGLRCFANARLESGFKLFAEFGRLNERIAQSDLVLTGEGSIDQSTLMGKGVGEIARLCAEQRVPCLGLAGLLEKGSAEIAEQVFTRAYGVVPQWTSSAGSKADPQGWLSRLAAQAARHWQEEKVQG